MGQFLVFILVGLFIVWVIRGYRRYERSGPYTKEQFRRVLPTREQLARSELGLFVALVAKVAKADGRVDELEAELIGNMFTDISAMFPDPAATKGLLKEIFALEKEQRTNVDEISLALNRLIGRDRHKCRMMMAFLVNLAFVDGHLSHAEERLLLKIAALFHFTRGEIETLLRQASGMHAAATTQSSLDAAYALLGMTPQDSMETIKKRYRALVKEYHPDIIKAQGKSDAYIEEATEKVQQINAAYETLKKARA